MVAMYSTASFHELVPKNAIQAFSYLILVKVPYTCKSTVCKFIHIALRYLFVITTILLVVFYCYYVHVMCIYLSNSQSFQNCNSVKFFCIAYYPFPSKDIAANSQFDQKFPFLLTNHPRYLPTNYPSEGSTFFASIFPHFLST